MDFGAELRGLDGLAELERFTFDGVHVNAGAGQGSRGRGAFRFSEEGPSALTLALLPPLRPSDETARTPDGGGP